MVNIKIVIVLLLIINIIFVYSSYHNGKNFYNRDENNNIKSKNSTKKIFDISHKYLPDYSRNDNIHHLMNMFLYMPLLFNPDIIFEFLSYILPIFIFRYITTNATIYPKSKNCDDSQFKLWYFINGHCYDKMFSGHMASSIIISFLLHKYGKITNTTLLFLYNFINAYLILISRSHYTVDVIMGIYVAITSYLLGINTDLLKIYL
jgi:hypothetical protein